MVSGGLTGVGVCEDKRCRRALRCIGRHRPGEQGWTVPCYDHHRDVLQPVVLDLLRTAPPHDPGEAEVIERGGRK